MKLLLPQLVVNVNLSVGETATFHSLRTLPWQQPFIHNGVEAFFEIPDSFQQITSDEREENGRSLVGPQQTVALNPLSFACLFAEDRYGRNSPHLDFRKNTAIEPDDISCNDLNSIFQDATLITDFEKQVCALTDPMQRERLLIKGMKTALLTKESLTRTSEWPVHRISDSFRKIYATLAAPVCERLRDEIWSMFLAPRYRPMTANKIKLFSNLCPVQEGSAFAGLMLTEYERLKAATDVSATDANEHLALLEGLSQIALRVGIDSFEISTKKGPISFLDDFAWPLILTGSESEVESLAMNMSSARSQKIAADLHLKLEHHLQADDLQSHHYRGLVYTCVDNWHQDRRPEQIKAMGELYLRVHQRFPQDEKIAETISTLLQHAVEYQDETDTDTIYQMFRLVTRPMRLAWCVGLGRGAKHFEMLQKLPEQQRRVILADYYFNVYSIRYPQHIEIISMERELSFMRNFFPDATLEDVYGALFFYLVLFGGESGFELASPYVPRLAASQKSKGYMRANRDALVGFGFSEKAADVWAAWSELNYVYSYFDNLRSLNRSFTKLKAIKSKAETTAGLGQQTKRSKVLAYLSLVLEQVAPTLNRFQAYLPLLSAIANNAGAIDLEEFIANAQNRIVSYGVTPEGKRRPQREIHVIESELAALRTELKKRLLGRLPIKYRAKVLFLLEPQTDFAKRALEEISRSGFLDSVVSGTSFLSEVGLERLARTLIQIHADARTGKMTRYRNLEALGFSRNLVKKWAKEEKITVPRTGISRNSSVFYKTQAKQLRLHNQPLRENGTSPLEALPKNVEVLAGLLSHDSPNLNQIKHQSETLLKTFNENHDALQDMYPRSFFEVKRNLKNILNGIIRLTHETKRSEQRDYTMEISGKPMAFARAAVSPEPTCQRIHESTGQNEDGQPYSRMLHGQFKVATFKFGNTDQGRTMLEITKSHTGQDCLLVETFYVSPTFLDLKTFEKAIIDYAVRLGIPKNRVYFAHKNQRAPLALWVADEVYRDSFWSRGM